MVQKECAGVEGGVVREPGFRNVGGWRRNQERFVASWLCVVWFDPIGENAALGKRRFL